MISDALRRFFATESASGILLAVAIVLALWFANSPFAADYAAFRQLPAEIRVGTGWLVLSWPLVRWVNELWMAFFFLVIALEIKRQLLAGELGTWREVVLPVGAALGGLLVPALVYIALNRDDPVAVRGWAIPAATDIAVAFGILMLLGSRVPASLKLFLAAVAIFDNLGVLMVGVIFNAALVSIPMLAAALGGSALLFVLNRRRVMSVLPYLALGMLIWVCLLKAGLPAVLAGVAVAFSIPMFADDERSPLEETLRALHPWVAFGVLPLFVFANAGVSLQGVSIETLTQPVPLGVAAGLVLGKALGVFGTAWLLSAVGAAELPEGANRWQFFGVCVLGGVGFGMGLFAVGVAFDGASAAHASQARVGVLCGSLVAAVLGTVILLRAERRGPARRRQQHEPSRFQ